MKPLFTSIAKAAVLLPLVLLAACASRPPAGPAGPADAAALMALEHWQVSGKVGLRQNGTGNSARLDWQQSGAAYTISLNGPLGLGAIRIEGDADGVTVTNKEGTHQAASPEALIERLSGWQIPVSELVYWVRGLPAPELPVLATEMAHGRLQRLSQAGWQIEYREYQWADGLLLPAKIVLERPQTRLTLLLKHWQTGAESP